MSVKADFFLLKALELANVRKGFTSPNPAVGAVLVKNNQVLAEGFHFATGCSHAEVEVLRQVSIEQTQGATLYVTLEPCCHFGRTPPCTDLIIQKNIKKVIYGFRDPNPKVAGKGEAILQAAGITCRYHELPEITAFYQSYSYWQKTHTPYKIAKIAMSLDGYISKKNGEPLALTSESARIFTHQQRKISDAIMSTATTILQDNPKLNVRLPEEEYHKPLYILDRQARLTGNEQIFKIHQDITLFHEQAYPASILQALAKKSHSLRYYPLRSIDNRLPLDEIFHQIGQDGRHQLWIEAGGQLLQSLLERRYLQELLIYIAPTLALEGAPAFITNPKMQQALQSAKFTQWLNLENDGAVRFVF